MTARAWEHSQFVTVTVEVPDWMVGYYKTQWGDENTDHEDVIQSFVENGLANAYDCARDDGYPIDDE